MVQRSSAKRCHWCGFRLCHRCRKATPSYPAKCGGSYAGPCDAASTRDHLLPRRLEPNRRKYSGYTPGPLMVVACRWCNSSRSDKTDAEWKALLSSKEYEGDAELRRRAVIERLRYPTFGEAD